MPACSCSARARAGPAVALKPTAIPRLFTPTSTPLPLPLLNHAVRVRVLGLLCRSVAAASVFPQTLITIDQAVYGSSAGGTWVMAWTCTRTIAIHFRHIGSGDGRGDVGHHGWAMILASTQ